ncbi:MAG: arylsulfatase [Pirellulales bacterium]
MLNLKSYLVTFIACLLASNYALADRPNIVYILLDDAGYGDFSCYGQKNFATPNIDRLAASGMRFTQHYAGSTVCAPTRCVVITGLHTGHSFIRGNSEVKPEGQRPISAETITLAELLKDAGYRTGAFGKWGLGPPGSEGDPTNQGFDEFYGYNCQRQAHTFYPKHLWHNSNKIPLDGETYSHDLIVEHALDFVRKNQDQPFFCFLPFTIPHASLHVPESTIGPFRKKFRQFEDVIGRYAGPDVRNPIAAFAGMMTKADESIGQLRDLLVELGLADNTLIMFSSDNGPHREGGHQPDFFNSNGGLRGYKRDLFEGGIRVPMIASWPGRIEADSLSDHISAHWDVLPTVCEATGIEIPEQIDGKSMLPTFLSESQQQKQHDYLYWEFYEKGGTRAVRFGDWKAVQLRLNNEINPPILLYNLAADRAETNDVAADRPELIAKARRYFAAAHTPSEHWRFRAR